MYVLSVIVICEEKMFEIHRLRRPWKATKGVGIVCLLVDI